MCWKRNENGRGLGWGIAALLARKLLMENEVTTEKVVEILRESMELDDK
jgi:hypothetical protein